jgi:hypothetical protein
MNTEWKEELRDCDFELARDQIADFLKIQSEEARQMGGEYIWEDKIANAVKAFLAQPNFETASALLESAPPFYTYFEESKPTGRFAFFKRNFRGGKQ